MIASTTCILHRPTFRFSLSHPSNRNPLKPNSFLKFSASKSVFFGGFGSKKVVSNTTMAELFKASAFESNTSSNAEEALRVLEDESFIGGSNEFGVRFMDEGLEGTLNHLSKWVVVAIFGGVILWRHDAEALWAATGSVANSMLSVALKRLFNQERPVSGLRSDPGMPSSHSQSIFFSVTYAVLSVAEWLGTNEFTSIFAAFAFTFGSYFSWLRVSQKLHTMNQVVVGAAFGFVSSLLWYSSWNAFVLEAFRSSLLFRAIIVLGSAGLCLAFLIYVFLYWLNEDM